MKRERFDVTYLSADSIQEGVGSSQITPLVLGLAEEGLKVQLMCLEKKALSTELKSVFQEAGVALMVKDFGSFGPVGGLGRIFRLSSSLKGSRMIHGRSDLATAAGILGQRDKPILWDVRSLWADQRLAIGNQGWNSFTAEGARLLENYCASNASAMTTLTAAVVPILEARHRILPKVQEVIPTCVQTDKFYLSPMPQLPLTCLMSGTFNTFYDLERTRQVILAIREFTDLKVLWARPSESSTTSLGLGEEVINGTRHEEMPDLVARSHFGIAICKQDDDKTLSAAVPTKIGEFLAAGRPMLISKGIGDLEQMLGSVRAGIILGHNDDLDGVAEELMDLIFDKDTPARCRELSMREFNMTSAVRKYISVYKKLIEL